jgi:hypothetical protein
MPVGVVVSVPLNETAGAGLLRFRTWLLKWIKSGRGKSPLKAKLFSEPCAKIHQEART